MTSATHCRSRAPSDAQAAQSHALVHSRTPTRPDARPRGLLWGRWFYALHHVYTDDARVKGTLITISSEVAGRLVILAVEEGQRIQKGDLLAQIQQDEYQAQVALHSAALEAAQSQLASAEADLALTRTLAEGQIQRLMLSSAHLAVSWPKPKRRQNSKNSVP